MPGPYKTFRTLSGRGMPRPPPQHTRQIRSAQRAVFTKRIREDNARCVVRDKKNEPRLPAARGSTLGGYTLHEIGNLDDLFLDGVLHQLRLIVNVELTHQIELVRFDRLHAQIQIAGDFFH